MEKKFSMEEFMNNVEKTYSNSIDKYSLAIKSIKEKAMIAEEQEKRNKEISSIEPISKKTRAAEEKDDLVLE